MSEKIRSQEQLNADKVLSRADQKLDRLSEIVERLGRRLQAKDGEIERLRASRDLLLNRAEKLRRRMIEIETHLTYGIRELNSGLIAQACQLAWQTLREDH